MIRRCESVAGRALIALLALAATSLLQAQERLVIHAGSVLAEPGKAPLRNSSIVITNDRIDSIEPGFVEPENARIIDLRHAFVLPGLIDTHIHLQFGGANYATDFVTLEDSYVALRGAEEARRALDSGFTTLRDMAGDADVVFPLRRATDDGIVAGPRILAAGQCIVPTGGGIIRGYRQDVAELLAESNLELPCDGPENCAQATRQAIKAGADLIKIVATGSILSPFSALSQQMSDDEIRVIVETARGMGVPVSAHAHGQPGIVAAIKAGARSIEHGTFGDDEALKLYLEHDAFLVPTLSSLRVLKARVESNPGMHPSVRANVLAANDQGFKMVRRAYEMGVKVAFGTDSNVGMLGDNAAEFRLLQSTGMSEQDMIRSATIIAADLLGLAGEIGTLAPGKQADVIAVIGDPLNDITELERVRFVMARGKVVKH